jgi:hypothetical protein
MFELLHDQKLRVLHVVMLAVSTCCFDKRV